MQVVIDIPENVYKYLKQEWVKVPEDDSVINQIMYGILHGIVLPKGHGGLISRSVVRKKCIKAQDWGDTNAYINRGLAIAVDFIDCAPAVIPADKGE